MAGGSVIFLSREISDPKGLLANLPQGKTKPASLAEPLPPDAMTEVLETSIRNLYRDWADQPVPALQGSTPRDAIKTPEGLEQVKFLLHSYENAEARQAREQQREPVSYDFLWKELGISR